MSHAIEAYHQSTNAHCRIGTSHQKLQLTLTLQPCPTSRPVEEPLHTASRNTQTPYVPHKDK